MCKRQNSCFGPVTTLQEWGGRGEGGEEGSAILFPTWHACMWACEIMQVHACECNNNILQITKQFGNEYEIRLCEQIVLTMTEIRVGFVVWCVLETLTSNVVKKTYLRPHVTPQQKSEFQWASLVFYMASSPGLPPASSNRPAVTKCLNSHATKEPLNHIRPHFH